MRVAAFLSLFFAPVLAAQPVLEDGRLRAEPTGGQRALMAVAGVAVGTVAVATVGAGAVSYASVDLASVAIAVATYPLGAATGVTLMGRALGLEAEFGPAFRDAAFSLPLAVIVGTATGTVVAAAIWLPTANVDSYLLPTLVGVGVGVIVAATIPAVRATRHITVRPTALTSPSGDTHSGLTFRVAL